jgi:hypothetical protein
MAKLGELAKIVRSKNAKPFVLTFDIMFPDKKTYDKVRATNVLTADFFGKLFNTPKEKIQMYYYDIVYAIKISMPRPYIQGDIEDGDNYAGQQYGPLVLLDIPIEK